MSTASFDAQLFFDNIEQWSQSAGFQRWGQASMLTPLSLEFYRTWIKNNYHGEMSYLEKHLALKENPQLLHQQIQSALVFTHNYVPHPKPFREPQASSQLRTALYAQGEDYHFWLKEKLESIAQKLHQTYPDEIFLCFTDSTPVLERDLAYRAGLGWVGKNTCLIHPKQGSLFLIGEIVTSLKFSQQALAIHDFCGTCTRCIDICPTGALESPKLLNAQKCISYLTIESRQLPAEHLRSPMGDLFFGCDLCQTICPWNQKAFPSQLEITPTRKLDIDAREKLILELKEILSLSGKKLQKRFEHTPLMRAGPFGLRRNALVVAANQNLKELGPEIQSWLTDPQLGSLAQWACEILSVARP